MKLYDSFYVMHVMHAGATGARFVVHLNPDHEIFAAHFPGNPITPGVCQIAMVRELATRYTRLHLTLHHIASIKYQNLLKPDGQSLVTISLDNVHADEDGNVALQATVSDEHTTYTKMSLTFSL
ncbi:MAG: hypothetical protein IJS59_08905 [Bacteroidaceae bacterium]|nr:hypothetical protein [Bacteroidaceae bacterium]